MVKFYRPILFVFLQATIIPHGPLTAVDDLPTKLAGLHSSLTSLKSKLQALQHGLISIYEDLNQGKPPYFVARNIKRLIKLKLDGLTVTPDPDIFDDGTGEFSQTITYQLSPGTQVTLEFKHNRNTKQGQIAIECSGLNEYARWEKIADYANLVAVLMNAGGGGVMSMDENGVAFTWPFQENQWYSFQLDALVKVTLLLAQATGGLTQKIIDAGKEKIVAGQVMTKSAEAFDLFKKILMSSNLHETFKRSVLKNSFYGQRLHFLFIKALDFIKSGDVGNSDWQKVFKIINRFFNESDYAAQADLFYFKACHTPSPIDLTQTPDEVTIPDYNVLTEQNLEAYDQDISQDPIKKVCAVSSFRGGLIQNILQKIVKDKLYEKLSDATWQGLLSLIEQHADFFACRGSWSKTGIGASIELKLILQAAEINGHHQYVDKIKEKINFLSTLSQVDSLQKKNADYLSAGGVLSESLFEYYFNQYFVKILSDQLVLEIIKNAYVQFPNAVRAMSEDFLAGGLIDYDDEVKKKSLIVLRFFEKEDMLFRSRVILTALLKQTKNFGWVNKTAGQWIGGMAKPQSPLDLEILKSLNVGLVVSLQKINFDVSISTDIDFINWYSPVKDFSIPTVDQVNEFVQRVDQAHAKGKRVIVHCTAGIGRTGTMLACWFVAKKNMTAKEAIKTVRKFRPGSIETEEQIQFVSDYYDTVHI